MQEAGHIKIGAKALEVAVTQLGQKEVPAGSNKGPMVNEYLKAAGLNPGYAWCQAFVFWCYREAAKALGITNPVVRTASVMACWTKTTPSLHILKEHALRDPKIVSPGDLMVWRHGNATGHVGIVEKVIRTEAGCVIHTIEGNTNSNGSREGTTVMRKVRLLTDKQLIGFIKFS